MTTDGSDGAGFARQVQQRFGVQIRDLRKSRGMSQAGLAGQLAAVGCVLHQTAIAKIEAGTRPTTVAELAALALVLDQEAEQLVTRYVMSPPPGLAAELANRGLAAIEAENAQLEARLGELNEMRAAFLRKVIRPSETEDDEFTQEEIADAGDRWLEQLGDIERGK